MLEAVRNFIWYLGLVVCGFSLGTSCILFLQVHQLQQERVPGVTEAEIQNMPPGAVNFKGLGNGWITFDLDNKTYYRKGTMIFAK